MRPSVLWSMVENLPRDSAFVKAFVPAAQWSDTDHLLALNADLLAIANWQRGGGKGPRPEPVPRPADKRKASGEQIVADTFNSPADFMAWREKQLTPIGGDEEAASVP